MRLICRWFTLKKTSAIDNTDPSNDADMNNMETGPTSMSMQLCNIMNYAISMIRFVNTKMSDLRIWSGEFLQLFG